MHPVFLLGSLFPATALTVVGFFTLFAAERSAGRVQRIGKVLGVWLFILAGLVIVAGVVASVAGPSPWGEGMRHHHGRMMRSHHQGGMQPTGHEPAPAPAPATAPPATPQK